MVDLALASVSRTNYILHIIYILCILSSGSFVPKEYIESIRFWAKASQATDDIKMDLDFPPTKVISLTTEWQQVRTH